MKAIVLGGSNGIGLAVVNQLISMDKEVIVLDICPPAIQCMCKYQYCDLRFLDEQQINDLALDHDVDTLFISAGIGRVADFEYLHTAEIDKLMTINVLSIIKVIRLFYDRIKNHELFFCGVMGSIAGFVSSPMFSVYAASKAALCRFVESVNIELECTGVTNRILNVSTTSVQGTRFNGGENDLGLVADFAADIVSHLYSQDEMYFGKEELCRDIIRRYSQDAHAFGVQSYQYKVDSGRVVNEQKTVIGYLSGTFDLFHIGHLNLLKRAKGMCDYLIVGVHDSGAWKGKETFIPLDERKAIVGACQYVDKVVDSCREDSDAWELWHYNKLFVGSDYKGTERFNRYEEYFADKGVEIVYFPYTQGTSSTQVRKAVSQEISVKK